MMTFFFLCVCMNSNAKHNQDMSTLQTDKVHQTGGTHPHADHAGMNCCRKMRQLNQDLNVFEDGSSSVE